MRKEWNALEALKHSRHDWLNKLQLIKGNIALDRLDRVQHIINEIILDAKHESDISNLQADNFATLIMTANWESNYFIIDYEVLGEIRNLATYDSALTIWCNRFFDMLNHVVYKNGENHLSLSIDLTKKDPRFFLDFSGTIENMEEMKQWIADNPFPQSSIKMNETIIHQHEFSVAVTLT